MDIDTLITDTGATPEEVSAFLAHGVSRVIRAEPGLEVDADEMPGLL